MITSATNAVAQGRYKKISEMTQNQPVAKQQWVVYGQQHQSTLKQVASTVREDNMNTIQSWKEVTELYEKEMIRDYPEGLWVDPAESEADSISWSDWFILSSRGKHLRFVGVSPSEVCQKIKSQKVSAQYT